MTVEHTPIADAVAELHAGRPRTASPAPTPPAPGTVLPIGSAFPDGKLLDARGEPTTFQQVTDGKPAVAIFYRGAWCPYCNVALTAYRDELSATLGERGIALVAISPQKPDGSLSAQEKNQLDFAVLSDPGNQIASALGILTELSAEKQQQMREFGNEITELNADGTAGLPMPTAAVVDAEGRLAWIDVHPDHTTRTEPAQILAALDTLGS